jgi:hypothetical protein
MLYKDPVMARTDSAGFPAEADPRMQRRAMTNFMVGRIQNSSLKNNELFHVN